MKYKKGKHIVVIVLFVVIIALPSIFYWLKGDQFIESVSKQKDKISELYEGEFEENVTPYFLKD